MAEIAREVGGLLERNERYAALRYAMAASDQLLRTPSDALRIDLRERVFKQISARGVYYQADDFESVDYGQYELAADLPMFRGPSIEEAVLESGDYFCVMGAAQTFGRLVRRPWPVLLGETLGLPALNLSSGGAGPEFFLNPKLIQLACGARFVVLQVMSGRSVGCEDYPGGARITNEGKRTNVNRMQVLKGLWEKDPAIALKYVRRWNESYLALYRELRALIDRPILLLWISNRSPDAWKPERLLNKPQMGSFPQLVGRKLYESVAALFDARFEHLTGPSNEQPLSRITGEPCPFLGFRGKDFQTEITYYPSSADNALLAESLAPLARDMLRTSGRVRGRIRAHRP